MVAMTGLSAFTMQILIPSLPTLAVALGVGYGTAQLTLTLYLAGIALGQLLYGPLSDRFGRRPLLLGGLALYAAASLAAALAPAAGWLIAARIAQAVGGCAGQVLGRAMIRDTWPRDRAASVMGYVTMAMTVAPMVSPTLGSLLDARFGWRATMLACLAAGLALLLAVRRHLPETLAAPQPLPGLPGLAGAYAQLGRLAAFRAFAAVTATSTGVFFAFLAGAPRVVVDGLGYGAHAFALGFAGLALTFAFGSFLAGRFSPRFGVLRMLRIGTAITTLSALATLLSVLLLPPSLPALFVPVILMTIGNGLTQPNAIAGAVSVRPQLAGTASGLTGCLQMGFGALVTALVGVTESGAGVGTALAMLGSALGTQLALRGVMRAG
nr:Bcr/CflA family efflux MFS transporter [Roseomonas acroporae]